MGPQWLLVDMSGGYQSFALRGLVTFHEISVIINHLLLRTPQVIRMQLYHLFVSELSLTKQ